MVTITDDMLTALCRAVRSMSDSTRAELTELAEACVIDLSIAGVYLKNPVDQLGLQAIKLYCKANYGYDAETDVKKFRDSYNALKVSMALCGDYSTKEE